MTITTDELLALCAIAQERGPWRVMRSGHIRNRRGECPICAAANSVLDTGATFAARSAAIASLGASYGRHDAITEVIEASDCTDHPRRPDLMAALGMDGAA
jgi:hypothetical protein